MTKKQLLKLLTELGKQLLEEGAEGEVGVVGGAAMVLAFDARAATKDVDSIFKPADLIRNAVKKIGKKNGLASDWLNDSVKGFLPGDPANKIEVLNVPGLRVWVPEPEYMLAMKAISARIDTKDADDLRLLVGKLKLTSANEVLEIVEKYYPAKVVPAKVKFFVEELFDIAGGTKVHPWRLCPLGHHWVREHEEHISPSRKHPDGLITTRRGHCARNPTHKDQLYPDEIREITALHFKAVKDQPCPIELDFPTRGSQYDKLIAGWTQYWNEIFKSSNPLTPNIVKALIATESGFEINALANKKNQNSARGLMQITNATRKILGDEKGELKEHFISATREDLNEPSINICAGIRWLYRKREIASAKLHRMATWEEAVYEYKGGDTVPKKRAEELMGKFFNAIGVLEKCAEK